MKQSYVWVMKSRKRKIIMAINCRLSEIIFYIVCFDLYSTTLEISNLFAFRYYRVSFSIKACFNTLCELLNKSV